MSKNKELKRRIAIKYLEAGYNTQTELAKALNEKLKKYDIKFTVQRMTDLYSGKAKWRGEEISALLELLNCKYEDLFIEETKKRKRS